MRILHTADWHLGKRLDYFSRFEEQIAVLNEICTIADREKADVILVAGDLYDNFNPPTEAIELLYRTLKKLTNNGKRPVIAIAGNHDSPDRIDSPDVLARENGIFFAGKPTLEFSAFTVENSFRVTKGEKGFLEIQLPQYSYPLRLLITPFANEHRLKEYLGEDEQMGLNEVLSKNWQELADKYCDDKGVNLLTTHLYMNKRGGPVLEEPEGEKPLRIGFADIVYTDAIPQQIQYTALGHLHRYQEIGGHNAPVVYSSSPLQYSFSEADQEKKVVIIEAVPAERVNYTPIALTKGKPLVRKKMYDINTAVSWLENNPDCLVELTLATDTSISQNDKKRIEKAHNGIIYIIPEISGNSARIADDELSSRRNKSIDENFITYYKNRNNDQLPSEDLLKIFKEVLGNQTDKDT